MAKVLEQNRSRALAIKLRSIHCCIEDVRKAVYSLQNGRLDAEGLHDLYNMRATPTELQDIRQHQLEHAEGTCYKHQQKAKTAPVPSKIKLQHLQCVKHLRSIIVIGRQYVNINSILILTNAKLFFWQSAIMVFEPENNILMLEDRSVVILGRVFIFKVAEHCVSMSGCGYTQKAQRGWWQPITDTYSMRAIDMAIH